VRAERRRKDFMWADVVVVVVVIVVLSLQVQAAGYISFSPPTVSA
jgi:t-SNARE complex subunit (syntaxin)